MVFLLVYALVALLTFVGRLFWAMWRGYIVNAHGAKRWLGNAWGIAAVWPVAFVIWGWIGLCWCFRCVPDYLAKMGRRVHNLNPTSRT